MDSAIRKIYFFIENFVPYESKGEIELTDNGYRVKVLFFDTILCKEVNEFLHFTRDGDLIQN